MGGGNSGQAIPSRRADVADTGLAEVMGALTVPRGHIIIFGRLLRNLVLSRQQFRIRRSMPSLPRNT